MQNRWSALALLFSARTVMAFQFQSVAALTPLIQDTYSAGIAAVGFLLGLYMLPGVFLAIPGGRLARRFGEKEVVLAGLAVMTIGAGLMALSTGWTGAVAGRLIAGIGGILINLIMTKMVADWFEGKEIATAMSIFIVSWPAGIALALVALPLVAGSFGLVGAQWASAALAALAGFAFLTYRTAPVMEQVVAKKAPLQRRTFRIAVATGAAWGFLNAALAVVFGFGVALLVVRGGDIETSGQITSLTMIALALIGPVGGIIADRTGQYFALTAVSVVLMGIILAGIAAGASSLWLFVLFGLACGLCAGPIMSMPGLYLPAAERGAGMGIFFVLYYPTILSAPIVAGWAAEKSGDLEAAFLVGVGFAILTLVSLYAIWRLAQSRPDDPVILS